MGIRITPNSVIEHNLERAQKDAANSLERLSSGIKFTRSDPMPTERSLSDSLSKKMRELNSYKRNANDGLSLVQQADSALNEISNITVRLKELATQASSSALSDKERSFLFVEYQSLHDEVGRIAKTTEFNGMRLLNGNEGGSQSLSIRVGAPALNDEDRDQSVVSLRNLDSIIATPDALGLKSVSNLLKNSKGISLDDISDTFESSVETVSNSFDTAIETLAQYRSGFGAVASRLSKVNDVIDVAYENAASANSRLRDVDYASEVANLTRANILVQAGSSLLSHGNLPATIALQLVKNIDKG